MNDRILIMDAKAFSQYHEEKMILRDHLALERTYLASERTLMSYVRTMVGLIAVGGTIIKFFPEFLMILLGVVFILSGFFVMVIGFMRYIHIEIELSKISQKHFPEWKRDAFHKVLWWLLRELKLI